MKVRILLILFLFSFLTGGIFAQSPPASHSAVLNWGYTQGSDLAVGFNVFRIVKGSTGNWILLNNSLVPVATTTYIDNTISTGVDYLYYVTAVDSSGNQSNPSSTWDSGVIPGPLAITGPITGTVH